MASLKTTMPILVGLVCLLVRLPVLLTYQPVVYPDSGSYIELAENIRTGDYSSYRGERTPVYPVFMILCTMDHFVVWAAQSGLGIFISLMLYGMCLSETGSCRVSGTVGITSTLWLNLMFFEAAIMTETLATFFLVLSVWLMTRNWKWKHALLGIVVGLMALTKPFLVFCVPIYLAYYLLQGDLSRSPAVAVFGRMAQFVLPVLLIVGSWCVFNEIRLNYFGTTTLTGYNLTNHSGGFIEKAPDEYIVIKRLYTREREVYVERYGTHAMTIWKIKEEMMRATGLSYADLSKVLTGMSLGLFVRHPVLYAGSVVKAWMNFWRGTNYWQPEAMRSDAVRSICRIGWTIQKKLLVVMNAVFLLLVVCQTVPAIRRRGDNRLLSLIITVVVAGSILQALLEYGENARYAIPFQQLVFFSVCLFSFRMVKPLYGRWRGKIPG